MSPRDWRFQWNTVSNIPELESQIEELLGRLESDSPVDS